MRALALSVVAAMSMAVSLLPAAAAEPRYFETTVLTDAADDYTASGALDIVALHVAEKYSIVDGQGRDTLQVRVELRNLQEFESYNGQTEVELTLGYRLNGVDQTHAAVLSQVCYIPPPTKGPPCEPVQVSPAPHFATAGTGVTFVLDEAALGILPGSIISDLYAATATLEEGQRVYHDEAPQDNMNQPHGFELVPEERGGSYEVQGGFPFLRAQALTPMERFIVPGGESTFTLRYVVIEDLSSLDRVVFLYDGPDGWKIEANLGTDFVVNQGGNAIDVDFRVVAPANAAIGDSADMAVDAVLLQAGGHAENVFHLVVSGPRVEIPGYTFELVQPATLETAGPPALKVRILYLDQPLLRHRVAADFRQGEQVEAAVAAVEEGDGVYAIPFSFPRGGTWTMDVYVSELQPAPMKTFEVTVDQPADAPAPGWGFALLLVGLAWAERRRQG